MEDNNRINEENPVMIHGNRSVLLMSIISA